MADDQLIADGTLDAWQEIARRDDWHTRLVGSDIRMLISDLRRARHRLTEPARKADRLGEGVGASDMVLVPRKLTPAMLKAGQIAADDMRWKWCGLGTRKEGEGLDGMSFYVREAYDAMITVAPDPTHTREAEGEVARHKWTLEHSRADFDAWLEEYARNREISDVADVAFHERTTRLAFEGGARFYENWLANHTREAEIDRLAQFLHDEGGFGDAMTDRTWPEHDADTGQRGDGWVKIVPSDVVAHFRDVARRWLLPRAALFAGSAQ